MLLRFFECFIKTNDTTKPKLKRENTPYHTKQSVIDVDEGSIEIISNFDNVDYEYLPNSAVLHIYKKE